jgi:hypothetical protein
MPSRLRAGDCEAEFGALEAEREAKTRQRRSPGRKRRKTLGELVTSGAGKHRRLLRQLLFVVSRVAHQPIKVARVEPLDFLFDDAVVVLLVRI